MLLGKFESNAWSNPFCVQFLNEVRQTSCYWSDGLKMTDLLHNKHSNHHHKPLLSTKHFPNKPFNAKWEAHCWLASVDLQKGKWGFGPLVGVQSAVSAKNTARGWVEPYSPNSPNVWPTTIFLIELKNNLKGFSKFLHDTYCNYGMEHGMSTRTVTQINLFIMQHITCLSIP